MRCFKISFAIIAIIAVSAPSCVKESCCNCDNQAFDESSLLMVSFGCEFESELITRSEQSSFPEGVMTKIYAYSSGEDPSNRSPYPGTPVRAISDSSGKLSIADNHFLFLPYGEYDFYSASANCSTMRGLSFKDGLSARLENGTDYLWATGKEVAVKSNTELILRFRHSMALISINIIKGEDIDSIIIRKALLYPPVNGGRMRLSNGEISSSESTLNYGESFTLQGNRERVNLSYISLPLLEGIAIRVQFEIDLFYQGERSLRKLFNATLPSPRGGFRGGYRYSYKATASENEMLFNMATVNEWIYEAPVNIDISKVKTYE